MPVLPALVLLGSLVMVGHALGLQQAPPASGVVYALSQLNDTLFFWDAALRRGRRYVSECFRVLAPGGVLLVASFGQPETRLKYFEGHDTAEPWCALERETRKRIKQATRYPIFVLVAMGVALAVINLLVIPAFAKVFAQFHAQLPWATRLLIGTSNFMRDWWWLLLLALVGSLYAFIKWSNYNRCSWEYFHRCIRK